MLLILYLWLRISYFQFPLKVIFHHHTLTSYSNISLSYTLVQCTLLTYIICCNSLVGIVLYTLSPFIFWKQILLVQFYLCWLMIRQFLWARMHSRHSSVFFIDILCAYRLISASEKMEESVIIICTIPCWYHQPTGCK